MKTPFVIVAFLFTVIGLRGADGWECDFNSASVREAVGRNPNAEIYRDYDGAPVLRITVPPDKNHGAIGIPLSPELVAGKKVFFEAEIAYRNVTEPVNEPWNGVKFMVPFQGEDGKRVWKAYETLFVDGEDFEEIGAAFERAHPVSRVQIGGADVRLMRQRELVDFAVHWIETNRGR